MTAPVSTAVDRTRTKACAHRGDSARERENTIPAIRSAIDHGADYVEIDVRLSADGQVVVLHDPSPARLWGLDQDVIDLTWAQLCELGDGQVRIPLLAEVLELFRDSGATLLIDMDETAPAAPAHQVVAAAGIPVAWCGDLAAMQILRDLDPHTEIWMPWDRAAPPRPEDLADLRPTYVNLSFAWATSTMVQAIHDLGHQVATWTVDDEHGMRWALELGVDCLTTNRLSHFQQVRDAATVTDPAATARDERNSSSAVDLDAVLATARELGRWAIDVTRSMEPGTIETKKGPADLVTEVDTGIERHVRDVVGRRFPHFRFVGEELGGDAADGLPCWYLDPVDGTTNFANGLPWSSFSLALVVDGVPVVGVVADPWRGEVFEAVAGRGARLNGELLRIPVATGEGDPLSGRVVSTELAGHLPWPGMLGLLEALGRRDCTMRIMGSGTLTLTGVAAGRGVGSVIGSFGPVDHLAAVLIVTEAGGTVLDTSGEPNLFPAAGGILAAAPHAASALYDLWQETLPGE